MMRVLVVLITGFVLGLSSAAVADEVTITVEGRGGPFPADEPGGSGIVALGVDYEVVLPVSLGAGGGGSGRPQHKPFVIRKVNGASSLFFYEALVRGEVLKKVTVSFKKKGKGKGKDKEEYLVITFNEVLVSSYNMNGGGGEDEATVETIALEFSNMQLAHPPTGKVVTTSLGSK